MRISTIKFKKGIIKMIFYITETQNLNDVRTPVKIDVKNLTQAKQYASKNQVYQNTTLKIYQNIYNGFGGNCLSCKDTQFNTKWIDTI